MIDNTLGWAFAFSIWLTAASRQAIHLGLYTSRLLKFAGMGVRRLETFAERNPEICFDVDLRELVEAYTKEENKKPVIVLDLLSVLPIFRGIPTFGGTQTKEVVERFAKFYRSLEDLGAEVVVFTDGVVADTKERTYIKRRAEEIDTVALHFTVLELFPFFEDNLCSFSSVAVNAVSIFLSKINCEHYSSSVECDWEIAKYAEENCCFAILAQDTDFLIYRGARHYLSMKHFDMVNMKTKEYSQKNLAQELGLEIQHLPILASLIGNDIIKQEDLTKFHSYLNEYRSRIDYYKNFYKVSKYILDQFSLGKSKDETLSAICAQAFGTADYEDFKKSLQIYDTSYPLEPKPLDETLGEGWLEVQKLARDFKCMQAIIIGTTIYSGPYDEDFIKRPFLPFFMLTMKLRQRIYGVLLQEKPLIDQKPHFVEEIHFSGFDSFPPYRKTPIIEPHFKHSGLVHLWTSEDEETLAETMSLFHFCLGIGTEITDLKERHLIIPTASIKYLFNEGFYILKWEMEALVVSMVLLDFYSLDRLKAIPGPPVDTRGITLYTVFTQTCFLTLDAETSCGSFLNSDEYNPERFHDGKLFQLKYREAKSRINFDDLCENNEIVIKTAKKIINILKN